MAWHDEAIARVLMNRYSITRDVALQTVAALMSDINSDIAKHPKRDEVVLLATLKFAVNMNHLPEPPSKGSNTINEKRLKGIRTILRSNFNEANRAVMRPDPTTNYYSTTINDFLEQDLRRLSSLIANEEKAKSGIGEAIERIYQQCAATIPTKPTAAVTQQDITLRLHYKQRLEQARNVFPAPAEAPTPLKADSSETELPAPLRVFDAASAAASPLSAAAKKAGSLSPEDARKTMLNKTVKNLTNALERVGDESFNQKEPALQLRTLQSIDKYIKVIKDNSVQTGGAAAEMVDGLDAQANITQFKNNLLALKATLEKQIDAVNRIFVSPDPRSVILPLAPIINAANGLLAVRNAISDFDHLTEGAQIDLPGLLKGLSDIQKSLAANKLIKGLKSDALTSNQQILDRLPASLQAQPDRAASAASSAVTTSHRSSPSSGLFGGPPKQLIDMSVLVRATEQLATLKRVHADDRVVQNLFNSVLDLFERLTSASDRQPKVDYEFVRGKIGALRQLGVELTKLDGKDNESTKLINNVVEALENASKGTLNTQAMELRGGPS